jgi:hypothetical protein
VTDKDTGKIVFEKRWRARSSASANAASPLVDGNLVFVTANYAVGAIVLDFSTSPPRELWSGDDAISAHYARTGSCTDCHGPTQTGQQLRAVELRTGKVLWKMLATEHGGSLTLINGRLMFIRDDGQIFKIKPNQERLEVEGNFKAIEGTIRSFPALGSGLICMRNTKVLTCLTAQK